VTTGDLVNLGECTMKDHRLWMFSLLLIVTSSLSGDAQEKEAPLPTEEEQLERAEWMVPEYYDKVGKRLTATLADEEIPIRQRVQAAKRLGIMKYPPAIETLIRNNLLLDPDIVISGNETEPLVAVNVLAQYGDAAVPRIIDAYLEEENESGRSRLYMAIGNRRTALVYAKGLAVGIKEKDRSKRLEELVKRLSQ
jgi:HEAT repeat protein